MVKHHGNIVIVEDDAGLRAALQRLLQTVGFEVVAFATGSDALKDASIATADCLVLDLYLPDMTGFELHRRLGEAGRVPPVVMITAHDDAQNRRQARDVGATTYLTKPFLGHALVDAVSKTVGHVASPG